MQAKILKSSIPTWVKRDELVTPTSKELVELFDNIKFTHTSSNRLSVDICFTIRTTYQNTLYVKRNNSSAHFRTSLKHFVDEKEVYYCGLLSIKEFLDRTFYKNYTQYMVNSSLIPIGVTHMDKSLIIYFHIVLAGYIESNCFDSITPSNVGVFEKIEDFIDKPQGRKFDDLIVPTLKIISKRGDLK